MPKNTTNDIQYAVTYDDNYLHVLIVDPGLTIDTGLSNITIRNNLQGIEAAIAALSNRNDVASAKLNQIRQDRGL